MALYFYLNEVGADLVFSATGTVNTAGLTNPTSYTFGNQLNAGLAQIIVAGISNGTQYDGITGPSDFGAGGGTTSPIGVSGDLVGIQGLFSNIMLETCRT